MSRNNTPFAATPAPELSWTAGDEPYSTRFDDLYYSRDDGMAESRHVFLGGNRIPERWGEHPGPDFRIAETGFGTGLNFLLSWQAWRQQAGPRPRLHYVSVEKFPLDQQSLARALAPWQSLAPLSRQLVDAWPGRVPGQHRLCFENGAVVLDLWWEEAVSTFAELALQGPLFDAWFLDGFAPARNESMWQPRLYQSMATLSRPGATVATFTAAGHVRRGLAAAGFEVSKVAGFGRKRESLAGRIHQPGPATTAADTPWDLVETPSDRPVSAIIIGAGLAGCSLARALADRGIKVQLLDRGAMAGEASGNEQGILYTRLSRKHSSLTDFALQSFIHASKMYRRGFSDGSLREGIDGQLCGSFHQQSDDEEMAYLGEALSGIEQLAQVLSAAEAAEQLGEQPVLGGYWFPGSGWLRPPAVCQSLLQSPLIELRENCGELQLQRQQARWQALGRSGELVAEAEIAVLCAGNGTTAFTDTADLPLQSIRGQTSYLPATEASSRLRSALCHQGYISPAREGIHCIGASFKLRDSGQELRPAEHRENLQKLAAALPQWAKDLAALDPAEMHGRVGFRCASPDYLPVAGPVPNREEFLQTYAPLRKNARQVMDSRGRYMPGLFISTAHGSRGLSSAPLCAQLLASQICNEPPPLSRELCRALSPARFLIRDLSRNRV